MAEFDWKKALSEPPVQHGKIGFTDELRRKIHTQAAAGTGKTTRRLGAWLGGGIAVAAIAAVLFLTPVAQLWQDTPNNNVQAGPPITDTDTKAEVPFYTGALTEGMEVREYKDSDTMNRGNYEFNEHPIVIDKNIRTAASLQRGDVIMYNTPPAMWEKNPMYQQAEGFLPLTRVIGLPGETVSIENGQVYIDGRELDTFYGKYTYMGVPYDEFKPEMIEPGGLYDMKLQRMDPVKVPQGSVFVLGDFWFRSGDSRVFGPLAEKQIYGKVLGYKSN